MPLFTTLLSSHNKFDNFNWASIIFTSLFMMDLQMGGSILLRSILLIIVARSVNLAPRPTALWEVHLVGYISGFCFR